MGITIGEFLEIFINIVMEIFKIFEGMTNKDDAEAETPEA